MEERIMPLSTAVTQRPIKFGRSRLHRFLRKYAVYYNKSRVHRSLDKDAPFHRAASASASSHHDLFLAVFITNTAESKFSALTGR
jgi:hypothetical protein